MYLDYAENQAARQIPMKMADWVQAARRFLQFNEYEVLTNAGYGLGRGREATRRGTIQRFPREAGPGARNRFDSEVKRIEGYETE